MLEQLCIALFLQLARVLTSCGFLHCLLRTSERIRSDIRPGSIRIRGQHRSGGVLSLHYAKPCVLVEMRPKVEPAVHTALVAGADEGSALDDVMESVKARRGEVFLVRVHLETWQGAKVVTGPLPGVAEHIVEAL